MEYMKLTADLYTGVPEMDEQHQGIVDKINRLAVLLSEDRVQEAIEFFRNELIPFVAWHLEEEEKFMESVGYPMLEEHRQHHRWVLELFTKVGEEIKDKRSARQTLALLTGWLYGHVGKVDARGYGRFYQEIVQGGKA